MKKYKTRPIEEIFKYYEMKLQVVEGETCQGCYFNRRYRCGYIRNSAGLCSKYDRDDRKSVIFKQIGK